MPVMDGFEATRQIRRFENANAKIPILATTANVADEVEEESRKVGMDDFLSKPFTKEKILSKLAYWLKPDVKKAN